MRFRLNFTTFLSKHSPDFLRDVYYGRVNDPLNASTLCTHTLINKSIPRQFNGFRLKLLNPLP